MNGARTERHDPARAPEQFDHVAPPIWTGVGENPLQTGPTSGAPSNG